MLNCATCHANDDRHFKLFGQDCAQCHATDRWTIPEFQHPSPSSTDCAQCHQAPPSHYMMHFKMISARVAGKPHARTIVACIGPKTAETAAEFGLRVDVQPETYTTAALVEALAHYFREEAR